MTNKPKRDCPEVREGAVRIVIDHQGEDSSQWAAIESIAERIGYSAQTLANWVRQADRDRGLRNGISTAERDRSRTLERENQRAEAGERYFTQDIGLVCPGGARPPTEAVVSFVDEHRQVYGVESISEVLPIAPSTYRVQAARKRGPSLVPAQAKRDEALSPEMNAPGMRISRSTMPAQFGIGLIGRLLMWPVAQWNGWLKLVPSLPSAVSATLTTTPSPKALLDSRRRR